MEADALLVTLANDLSSTYDLSKETARKLSTKSFLPHRLLSTNGKESKLGGVKKRGKIAIYRYISYRLGEDILSLNAVMIDKDEERVSWRVDGPDHLLLNKEDRYPELNITVGAWFDEFFDAEQKFRMLVDAVAPRNGSPK